MATQVSGGGDRAVLSELEGLVRETYTLWDEEWVGFSWRNYTYDHVQRVRALARTIGAEEGADDRVLNFAGLLHDITKAYDGEIITDEQGNRVLDENGFWQNETLAPARENVVTEVYDRLALAGQLHNVSGAHMADWLLSERGYSADFRVAVGAAIEAHLLADDSATVEGRSLYDADTIDANIGMPRVLPQHSDRDAPPGCDIRQPRRVLSRVAASQPGRPPARVPHGSCRDLD